MTPEQAIPHAARLVCGVAAHDADETHDVLLSLDVDGLRALAVVLAASVDPDRPLGGLTRTETPAQLVGRIVLAVTIRTGVGVTAIYGRDRHADVADGRAIACWVASELGLGPSAIGRALDRNHATVMHAIDRVINTPRLLGLAREVLADLQQEDE